MAPPQVAGWSSARRGSSCLLSSGTIAFPRPLHAEDGLRQDTKALTDPSPKACGESGFRRGDWELSSKRSGRPGTPGHLQTRPPCSSRKAGILIAAAGLPRPLPFSTPRFKGKGEGSSLPVTGVRGLIRLSQPGGKSAAPAAQGPSGSRRDLPAHFLPRRGWGGSPLQHARPTGGRMDGRTAAGEHRALGWG